MDDRKQRQPARILAAAVKHSSRKVTVMKTLVRSALLALLVAGLGLPATADVVHLRNGQKQAGLIIANDPSQPTVTIRTSMGELAIPRSKVERIEDEPDALGYAHIAQEFINAGDYERAAAEVAEGLKLDKDNSVLKEKLAVIEAARGKAQEAAALEQARNFDKVLADAQAMAKEKKFDEAIRLLRTVDPVGDPGRTATYRQVASQIYTAWGVARADHQDPTAAVEHLQMALRLDPKNEEARRQLVRVWEGNPTKLDEIIAFYKNSTKPEDRLRLADAYFRQKNYEQALPIYLEYYSQAGAGDQMAYDRIRLMFDMLHRQYADQGNYAKAIEAYTQFLEFSPEESQAPLVRYEYMLKRSQTDMSDLNGRVELAKFAEERGMAETAREEYRNILSIDPQHAGARAGLKRFADADAQDLRDFFAQGEYLLVRQKARQIADEYAMFPEIVKEATELDAKAEVEQRKVAKSKQQEAVALALRGDDYYNQALAYLSAYTSAERDRTVRVFSPKTEAAKNLQRALFSWRQALQISPELGAPTSYDLYNKIADAQAKYIVLTNPYAPRLPSRDLNRMKRGADSKGSK
jgi:tetratricopeptide (TPR) repeat protein